MKQVKPFAILLLVLSLLTSGVALADRGHWHGGGGPHVGIGFYFGPGYGPYYPYYGYPYPYGYPYYPYYPYPAVPQSPPVYIEQGNQEQAPQLSAPQQDYYWYHCNKPEGYYPYVKQCPEGWQKVSPEPPKQ